MALELLNKRNKKYLLPEEQKKQRFNKMKTLQSLLQRDTF